MVNPNAHFDREMMEDAAVEVVENFMRHATGVGFPAHLTKRRLSICFVDAVLYEEPGDDDSDGADEE